MSHVAHGSPEQARARLSELLRLFALATYLLLPSATRSMELDYDCAHYVRFLDLALASGHPPRGSTEHAALSNVRRRDTATLTLKVRFNVWNHGRLFSLSDPPKIDGLDDYTLALLRQMSIEHGYGEDGMDVQRGQLPDAPIISSSGDSGRMMSEVDADQARSAATSTTLTLRAALSLDAF